MSKTPPAPLKLYNTMSRTKEVFTPLDPRNVRMYVCGPTVYDFAHIGNARPAIVFDVLFRLLTYMAGQGAFDGGKGETQVTYVSNITDVDDKINARAFERWTKTRPLLAEMRELTEATNAQYRKDLDALNVLRPTATPRATDFVAAGEQPTDMVRIIAKLIAKGVAYEAEKHVLFSPTAMDATHPHLKYGALSRRSLDDMLAGARVDVAPYKRDPMDFVLWKPSNPETEPGWESPWGYGRPGWHIECSAMAGALLGETFDIHAGGIDLVFPHHENEIAQTCCAFGVEKMASIWMHNGFLQVEGQKMSKSLGNFFTIDEHLTQATVGGRTWPGEVLRLAMLKTHYLQPIDWTVRALEEAKSNLDRWSRHVRTLEPRQSDIEVDQIFLARLSDDLNLPMAIKRLNELSAQAAGAGMIAGPPTGELAYSRDERRRAAGKLKAAMEFLGIWPSEKIDAIVATAAVETLIAARLDARRARNFAESDRIRDELAAMGIQLKDGKDANGEPTTTWEVKR